MIYIIVGKRGYSHEYKNCYANTNLQKTQNKLKELINRTEKIKEAKRELMSYYFDELSRVPNTKGLHFTISEEILAAYYSNNNTLIKEAKDKLAIKYNLKIEEINSNDDQFTFSIDEIVLDD